MSVNITRISQDDLILKASLLIAAVVLIPKSGLEIFTTRYAFMSRAGGLDASANDRMCTLHHEGAIHHDVGMLASGPRH